MAYGMILICNLHMPFYFWGTFAEYSYTVHSKLGNKSATKTFYFKECLCNVKVKDIYTFIKNHLFTN